MDEVYEAAKKLQDSGAVKYGMAMDASRARYDNLMYMNGGFSGREGRRLLQGRCRQPAEH